MSTFDDTRLRYLNVLEKVVADGGDGTGLLKVVLELCTTSKILNDDVAESRELFEFASHEFAARTLIRTMAASYEAKLFLLRQLLVQFHAVGEIVLREDELIQLGGKLTKINSTGSVSASQHYVKFQDSLIHTALIWERTGKGKSIAWKDHPNWTDVLSFLKIRNRLMHPKRRSDLDVSDTEIEALNRAIDWFSDYFTSFFGASQRA